MSLVTLHAAVSDIGLQRRTNEDTYVVAPPLFAVCDGMGGAEAGEVASALAASAAVYARAAQRAEESGMGTTLTAVAIDGARADFVHVGDSRAYLLRDGQLRLLSEDHSLVGELVREGRMTWEQAAVHPQRSILSRALGTEPEVEIDEFSLELRAGDVLLLCSDGLSGDLSPEVLRDRLAAADPAEAARGLVAAARAAGGHDNITAVVVRLVEETPQPSPPAASGTGAAVAATAQGASRTPLRSRGGDGESPADDTAAHDEATTDRASLATVAAADADSAAGSATAGRPSGRPEGAARVSHTVARGQPVSATARGAASHRARRRLGCLVVLLALVALLSMAGVVVANTCYFVGEEDGQLAVFSGLPWSLGPLQLHTVYLRTTHAYALLDPAERELVDARRVRTREGALRLAEELGMVE